MRSYKVQNIEITSASIDDPISGEWKNYRRSLVIKDVVKIFLALFIETAMIDCIHKVQSIKIYLGGQYRYYGKPCHKKFWKLYVNSLPADGPYTSQFYPRGDPKADYNLKIHVIRKTNWFYRLLRSVGVTVLINYCFSIDFFNVMKQICVVLIKKFSLAKIQFLLSKRLLLRNVIFGFEWRPVFGWWLAGKISSLKFAPLFHHDCSQEHGPKSRHYSCWHYPDHRFTWTEKHFASHALGKYITNTMYLKW